MRERPFFDNELRATPSLLILLGVSLILYVLGSVASVAILLFGLKDFSEESLSTLANDMYNLPWHLVVASQGVASIIMFFGSAFVFWRWFEKRPMSDFSWSSHQMVKFVLLSTLVQILFMPFLEWLAQANKNLSLPEGLRDLEIWMKDMEDKLSKLTEYFSEFSSFGQFVLAFLVIAVIAGICEEVLFRGLILRKIWLGTNNVHLAVWLSAAIFSAIHFQFYGFLPRMFLGIIFGYFYVFSGNIWVPIIGHIFNNGVIVIYMYLSNLQLIDKTAIENYQFPVAVTVITAVLGLVGIYYLKNHELDKNI